MTTCYNRLRGEVMESLLHAGAIDDLQKLDWLVKDVIELAARCVMYEVIGSGSDFDAVVGDNPIAAKVAELAEVPLITLAETHSDGVKGVQITGKLPETVQTVLLVSSLMDEIVQKVKIVRFFSDIDITASSVAVLVDPEDNPTDEHEELSNWCGLLHVFTRKELKEFEARYERARAQTSS
ncbi:MAG: hypothetical protein Q7R59_01760 [bacterium]|nr:hypothetical protein [bacterium]